VSSSIRPKPAAGRGLGGSAKCLGSVELWLNIDAAHGRTPAAPRAQRGSAYGQAFSGSGRPRFGPAARRDLASHARGRWFETSRAHGLIKPFLDWGSERWARGHSRPTLRTLTEHPLNARAQSERSSQMPSGLASDVGQQRSALLLHHDIWGQLRCSAAAQIGPCRDPSVVLVARSGRRREGCFRSRFSRKGGASRPALRRSEVVQSSHEISDHDLCRSCGRSGRRTGHVRGGDPVVIPGH
jgi:hypothetical protein